jgi:ketosteroid isomerase-like protein
MLVPAGGEVILEAEPRAIHNMVAPGLAGQPLAQGASGAPGEAMPEPDDPGRFCRPARREGESMTESDVRRFYEAMVQGDFEWLEERLQEDVVLEFPGSRFGGRFAGRRRVLVFLKQNQRLFREGLRFDLHWVGIVADHAVAQWTNSGITRSGEDYANRGTTIFRVDEKDRIVEIQDYLDTERLADTWPQH